MELHLPRREGRDQSEDDGLERGDRFRPPLTEHVHQGAPAGEPEDGGKRRRAVAVEVHHPTEPHRIGQRAACPPLLPVGAFPRRRDGGQVTFESRELDADAHELPIELLLGRCCLLLEQDLFRVGEGLVEGLVEAVAGQRWA